MSPLESRIHNGVLALAAALVAAAIALASCSGSEDEDAEQGRDVAADSSALSSEPGWRTGGYADDADCTACHRQIAQSFTTVAMSKTLMTADTAPLIEDLDQVFHHEPSKNFYQMKRSVEGEYTLRRWQQGPDGEPINILEQEIDYLIGSGNHVRVYTYKTPSNEMFQMPVVWFSQKKQWGMAPGFDRPDHFDFNRPVQRDCIFCHNPDPGLGETGDRYGRPYVYPHEFSVGIGCQRCHGPGAKHIELGYDQNASFESVRTSIVNPAKLPPRLSDDVCLQCHLQPTSERTSILRTLDHGDFSFRPGERLADHIIHIDYRNPDARAGRFEANHHGYRMMQSACFIESDGALQCITCHDPHHKPPLADRMARYRNSCLSCHAENACTVSDDTLAAHSHIDRSDCITCHMPAKRPGDAPHVLLTDHRVGIYPMSEVTEPIFVESFPDAADDKRVMSIFGREDSALSTEHRIYLALAGLKSGHGYDVGEFETLVEELGRDSLDADLYLADMYREEGEWDKAAAAYRAILDADADFAYARHGLALVLLQQGKNDEAIAEAERALRASPESPDARELLGTALMTAGRVDDAIGNYREAVRLRPLFATAHFNLAAAYVMRGDHERAAAHYARVTEIDPSQATAYARRGELLRAGGKVSEAIRIWRHGLTMSPDDVELALLLAETLLTAPRPEDRNLADGLRFAERAEELISSGTGVSPATVSVESGALRAFGLFVNGRGAEAEAAARETVARGGDASFDGAVLLALVEEQNGNRSAAMRMYQQARAMPEAARAIARPTPLRSALLSLARRAFGE
jgi:tetratricopeptide (TPR) repeat protein